MTFPACRCATLGLSAWRSALRTGAVRVCHVASLETCTFHEHGWDGTQTQRINSTALAREQHWVSGPKHHDSGYLPTSRYPANLVYAAELEAVSDERYKAPQDLRI
eukprot:2157383-Amphidinium_carterae.1